MRSLLLSFCISLLCFAAPLQFIQAQTPSASSDSLLAPTPPMGWNSWDSFGESVSEADIRANAQWMAQHLKDFGWQYVVVDMGWYVTNHAAGSNAANAQFSLDSYGRFTPASNPYPSATEDAGFKPLADYIHSLGLKFGIHILRGIPREAVRANAPIAGTSFHAAEAADVSDTCPWNPFNYGINPASPAAQAYYDSIAQLYAFWGVDFLKVDCIADHPYKGDDIRMIREALDKSGRSIVLSLSPGPAALEKGAEMSRYAQMWRISDDVWDIWHSNEQFPSGIENQFARAAKWAEYSAPGHWPDADMLPIGRLEPVAGWLEPRATRLTHDEQRTQLTLWSIFRSPLMIGGNLTRNDSWTESLLTNPEVLAVDQHSTGNHVVFSSEKAVVWLARPSFGEGYYLAVFNLENVPRTLRFSWKELSLPPGRHRRRDLWEHKDHAAAGALAVKLRAHASAFYQLAAP